MPEEPHHRLALLLPLVESLGEELNGADEDADRILVAVHYWLNQVEAAAAGQRLPARIQAALSLARAWLDENATGRSGEALPTARMIAWAAWMRSALLAAMRGEAWPSWPAEFVEAPVSCAGPGGVPTTRLGAGPSAACALPAHETGVRLNQARRSPSLSPAQVPHCAVQAAPRGSDRARNSPARAKREFATEANDLLEAIESGLLAWSAQGGRPAGLEEGLRALHTLKGSAGLVGVAPITTLAHVMETFLLELQKGARRIDAGVVELLLDGYRVLRQLVFELDAGHLPQDFPALLQEQAEEMRFRLAAMSHATPDEAPSADAMDDPAPVAPAADWLRIEAQKVDDLMELLEEWHRAHSALAEVTWDVPMVQRQAIYRSLSRIYQLSLDLQAAGAALRRTTLRRCFRKIQWLVDGLAPRLGKRVRFLEDGGDLDLDVGSEIAVSMILLHLARNALVHGLEAPEPRRAAGKPEVGTLWLSARSYEEALVIELRDDGAGVDRERILARARELGWVAPDAQPSVSELIELLFRPGLSTANDLTHHAGRGLGLEIVKAGVQKLGGAIEVESAPGQGTAFLIYLPCFGPPAGPVQISDRQATEIPRAKLPSASPPAAAAAPQPRAENEPVPAKP